MARCGCGTRDTGKLVQTVATSHRQVKALALSGDGRRLVTGGLDRSLRVWDMPQCKLLATILPVQKAPSTKSP